jgi:hypothetical protein
MKRRENSDGSWGKRPTLPADMLSNPIDLRVYLTDGEFRARVLRSQAWADYLAQPSIPPFDDGSNGFRPTQKPS